MIHDSPFWAIEGEVIPDTANFKEEGLVTPEEGEKKIMKFVGSCRELNPHHLGEMPECWPLHYPNIVIK